MIKIKSILVFVLLSVFQNVYSGCRNPWLGIFTGNDYYYLNVLDSKIQFGENYGFSTFTIEVHADWRYQSVNRFAVIFNGDTIFRGESITSNCSAVELPLKAGHYQTCGIATGCETSYFPLTGNFEIIVKSKPPAVVKDTVPNTGTTVTDDRFTLSGTSGATFQLKTRPINLGTKAAAPAGEEFELNSFLNRGRWITLKSEEEAIKYLSIYSFEGNLLGSYDINSTSATLPIDEIPSGLYVVRFATLSDRIITKKILVQ